jgi:hypothetical protein
VWAEAGSYFVQAGWKAVGIDTRRHVLLERQPLLVRREP